VFPQKFRKKISGNFYVKFGHFSPYIFSGKNNVKFGHFVNFSGKYDKNSGTLIIFRARIMYNTIRALLIFSYIFFKQKCTPPLKLTELLRLCREVQIRVLFKDSQH